MSPNTHLPHTTCNELRYVSRRRGLHVALATLLVAGASTASAANFARRVIDYAPGATPVNNFTDPAAALDAPTRLTGASTSFPSIVSPFSPPFLPSEIVSIGTGGWLTLQLDRFAIPQPGTPEIGVFTNVGLIDTQFPGGVAGDPPVTFGVDDALVEVSEDGITWISLGLRTFDLPTNAYTDLSDPFSPTPGNVPSDYGLPFTGTLPDFASLSYSPDMLNLLAGSGGGTWLDISATGLPQVGYVRFLVDDSVVGANFELDAVSVADQATGAVVPEPSTFLLAVAALAMLSLARQFRFSTF